MSVRGSGTGSGGRARVWPMPIALALLSGIGLVAALLGDGGWDAASWVGLGVPVVVCVWYGWLRRRP